ncbi:hypothetical protein Ddye_002896 [Dipteronia dyeriana]|uniref:Uncharacterized protein n=1 Tax=Dipteronia dyeriana TaxID=168575 RepID=A0AAD9XSE4_9ROSI|nr:hypothetical protein Ddye_002896 [Dipteronia dyeriana]
MHELKIKALKIEVTEKVIVHAVDFVNGYFAFSYIVWYYFANKAKVLVYSENPSYYPSNDEEYIELNLRKLIQIKAIVEDYDKPEANPKHQPKGG